LIFGRAEFSGGSPQVKEENILQQVPFQNQKKKSSTSSVGVHGRG
jgi:hypothetical protein